MNGEYLKAGSVCATSGSKIPIRLARAGSSWHFNLNIGNGANATRSTFLLSG
jgi:isoaspartyl peptidase/L-asparaginase-like protein (Ntn-hydrolase superfamily)